MKTLFLSIFLVLFTFGTSFSQKAAKIHYFNSTNVISYLQGFGCVKSYASYDDNHESNWAFNTVNGIKYHSSVAGLGLGYEQWSNSYLIPVYFRYQVFFKDIKPSLFQYFDVGYAFGDARKANSSYHKEEGRFLFSAGFGANFPVSNISHIYINIFYKLQKTYVDYYKYRYNRNYSFFGVGIGVMFF